MTKLYQNSNNNYPYIYIPKNLSSRKLVFFSSGCFSSCFGGRVGFYCRKATSEEKQWLKACIAANKFIPKEEALKDIIPEYVECIKSCIGQFANGKIYKTNSKSTKFRYYFDLDDANNINNCWNDYNFKPSTKEAYDRQQTKLNESKSLIGRYLKYIGRSKYLPVYGDYFLVEAMHSTGLKRLSDNTPNCGWSSDNYKDSFELMPKGFIPPNTLFKPKFEVGKWYKFTAKYLKQYINYANYSDNQSVSDRFYYDEFISNNGWKKGHNWSVLDVEPILLTDLSEIQQYLPDGHSDKIVLTTFKIGDKVRGKTKNITTVNGYTYSLFDIDYYRTIDSINGDKIFLNGDKSIQFYAKDFELVKEEFKVGDWVILSEEAKKTNDCKDWINAFQIDKINDKYIYKSNGYNQYISSFRKALPHEIPYVNDNINTGYNGTLNMTKEELLEEAKRRYPNNCKYKSIYDKNSINICNSEKFIFHNETSNICDKNGNFVYYEGKWAEIILLSESKSNYDHVITKVTDTTITISSELTSLPSNWCVEVTDENQDILVKYRNGGINRSKGERNTYLVSSNYFTTCITKNIIITFEQFKKWVLKEDNNYISGIDPITDNESFSYPSKNNFKCKIVTINTSIENRVKLINKRKLVTI